MDTGNRERGAATPEASLRDREIAETVEAVEAGNLAEGITIPRGVEAAPACRLKLYQVQFDGQQYFIEAASFASVVETWKRHVADLWGEDYEGDEEPESVALIHDEPVVRGPAPFTSADVSEVETAHRCWRLIEEITGRDGWQVTVHGERFSPTAGPSFCVSGPWPEGQRGWLHHREFVGVTRLAALQAAAEAWRKAVRSWGMDARR